MVSKGNVVTPLFLKPMKLNIPKIRKDWQLVQSVGSLSLCW